MKHRSCEFDMSKVPWTLGHTLTASLALEVAVNCTHARIHQATEFWLVCGLIHDLGVFNLCDRICFLYCRDAIASLVGRLAAGAQG